MAAKLLLLSLFLSLAPVYGLEVTGLRVINSSPSPASAVLSYAVQAGESYRHELNVTGEEGLYTIDLEYRRIAGAVEGLDETPLYRVRVQCSPSPNISLMVTYPDIAVSLPEDADEGACTIQPLVSPNGADTALHRNLTGLYSLRAAPSSRSAIAIIAVEARVEWADPSDPDIAETDAAYDGRYATLSVYNESDRDPRVFANATLVDNYPITSFDYWSLLAYVPKDEVFVRHREVYAASAPFHDASVPVPSYFSATEVRVDFYKPRFAVERVLSEILSDANGTRYMSISVGNCSQVGLVWSEGYTYTYTGEGDPTFYPEDYDVAFSRAVYGVRVPDAGYNGSATLCRDALDGLNRTCVALQEGYCASAFWIGAGQAEQVPEWHPVCEGAWLPDFDARSGAQLGPLNPPWRMGLASQYGADPASNTSYFFAAVSVSRRWVTLSVFAVAYDPSANDTVCPIEIQRIRLADDVRKPRERWWHARTNYYVTGGYSPEAGFFALTTFQRLYVFSVSPSTGRLQLAHVVNLDADNPQLFVEWEACAAERYSEYQDYAYSEEYVFEDGLHGNPFFPLSCGYTFHWVAEPRAEIGAYHAELTAVNFNTIGDHEYRVRIGYRHSASLEVFYSIQDGTWLFSPEVEGDSFYAYVANINPAQPNAHSFIKETADYYKTHGGPVLAYGYALISLYSDGVIGQAIVRLTRDDAQLPSAWIDFDISHIAPGNSSILVNLTDDVSGHAVARVIREYVSEEAPYNTEIVGQAAGVGGGAFAGTSVQLNGTAFVFSASGFIVPDIPFYAGGEGIISLSPGISIRQVFKFVTLCHNRAQTQYNCTVCRDEDDLLESGMCTSCTARAPPGFGELCGQSPAACAVDRCSARGKCTGRLAGCLCEPGWAGAGCSLHSGSCSQTQCSGGGECAPNGTGCICNEEMRRTGGDCGSCLPGWARVDVFGPCDRCAAGAFGPSCNWTSAAECGAEVCAGRGNCTSAGTCTCNPPYDPATRCVSHLCGPYGEPSATSPGCLCSPGHFWKPEVSATRQCVPTCAEGAIYDPSVARCVVVFVPAPPSSSSSDEDGQTSAASPRAAHYSAWRCVGWTMGGGRGRGPLLPGLGVAFALLVLPVALIFSLGS
jgi:hypothetical protein